MSQCQKVSSKKFKLDKTKKEGNDNKNDTVYLKFNKAPKLVIFITYQELDFSSDLKQ